MNPSNINLVHFPAIIKLHADDELLLIANRTDFENNQDINNMYFQAQDMLIDKLGHVFKLHKTEQIALSTTNDVMPLDEVIKLIQLHLSNHGACCVSKFSAHSIEDAFNCL
jgi:hypothetical protein